MNSPRAYVEIDLTALASNINKLRSGSSAKFLAVVKANAYGHGLIPIARAAVGNGADYLGTALVSEAIAIRDAGINSKILAWLISPGDEIEPALQKNIELSTGSLEVLKEIENVGVKLGITPVIHIEVDTGMSRGGFLDQWEELLKYLPSAKVKVIGLWSHFARADEPDRPETKQQIEKFAKYEKELLEIGITPEFTHLSNSAGILGFKEAHRSIIRGGIGMYGLSPDYQNLGSENSLGLKPVMKIYGKLALVKKVRAGSQVGYGGIKTLERDSILGVVALGYSDGLFRASQPTVGGNFKGSFAPLVGRISMDQCVVDLTDCPPANSGEYICMLGEEYCMAQDWAQAANTINYEIVTRVLSLIHI